MKKIIIYFMLLLLSGVAIADTCKQTYHNLNFKAVILGGEATCFYGKKFLAGHSYTILGNGDSQPDLGPWVGENMPFTASCRSSQSADCVFKFIPLCCHLK